MFCLLLHRPHLTDLIPAGAPGGMRTAHRMPNIPSKKTEYEELAEAELFSMRDGTDNGATPNQDNHQSR
jgi:hypothetical protein